MRTVRSTRPPKAYPTLSYAILELLTGGPLTGYELVKRFEASITYFWHALPSQVYAELRRLEHDGLIERCDLPAADRRNRKHFGLSAEGRAVLRIWAQAPSDLFRLKDEFQVRLLALSQLNEEEARRQLLTEQRLHRERLQVALRDQTRMEGRFGHEACLADPRVRYRYLSIDYGIAFAQNYLAWIDRALAALDEPGRESLVLSN